MGDELHDAVAIDHDLAAVGAHDVWIRIALVRALPEQQREAGAGLFPEHVELGDGLVPEAERDELLIGVLLPQRELVARKLLAAGRSPGREVGQQRDLALEAGLAPRAPLGVDQ